MTLRPPALLLVASVVVGCLAEDPSATGAVAPRAGGIGEAPEAPDAPAPGAPPAAPRFETVVLDLSGTILLRPAGDPIVAGGDAPEFLLAVPNGTRALHAHAEWSPPQVVGLELQPPGGERIRSWEGMPNTQLRPPIDMRVPAPLEPGDWWVYIGPSTVGGALTWTLTLTLEVPAGEAASVKAVGCEASRAAAPLPAPC